MIFVDSLADGMVLFGIVVILVCMQNMDGNEKSTGFVGSLCERVYNWGFRHPWIARPLWYFALLVVVLGVCYGAFNYFNLYHTDADSARYMLSAMVQAQAAIVAIVITLTLIAVQLTASAYSPRVIDIFKKNPDMWILLGFYGLSILYGFIVLKMVEGVEGEVISQDIGWFLGFVPISFEFCVSFAYWLETFTLVALFPYMLNIIDLLKPENIINRLAVKITKDNIFNSKEDPIQPIMDVIHSSIMKYDIATTKVGLESVRGRMIKIIDLNNEKQISKCFGDYFVRVCRLTVSKMDEESTGDVIRNLGAFGKLTAEKGLGYATCQVAWSLKDVGELTAEREFEDATCQVAWSLRDVGKATTKRAERWFEGATIEVIVSLEDVGEIAVEKRLDHATRQVAGSLRDVGKIAVEKGLEDVSSRVVQSLSVVGEIAVEKRLDRAPFRVAESLGVIGEIAAEMGRDRVISQTAWSLLNIGKIAAGEELKDATWKAAEYLAELTISSKKIAETAIRNYESKLKEQDRNSCGFRIIPDPFEEFMGVYKQQLEKLRAKKNLNNFHTTKHSQGTNT